MNLRNVLTTTTAAIALCAASSANAADPYLSVFGGVSSFDDEIQFSASNANSGFFFGGIPGFPYSATIAGGVTACAVGTVGKTTGGAAYCTFTAVPVTTGFTKVIGHFYFGSGKNGTTEFAWEEEFDTGFVIGGALGADFGNGFRGELELAYRQNDLESGDRVARNFSGRNTLTGYATGTFNKYDVLGPSTIVPVVTGVPIGSVSIPVTASPPGFPFNLNLPYQASDTANVSSSGEVNVWSLMANVWLDIDPFGINPAGVTTFIGGGIGYANLELEYDASMSTQLMGIGSVSYSLNDNESALAYQMGAGIGFDLGGGMMLSAQYRWFATDDVTLGSRDMRVESHNAMVGITLPLGNILP